MDGETLLLVTGRVGTTFKTLHENSISGAGDVPFLGLPWFKFRMSCSKKDHFVRNNWY